MQKFYTIFTEIGKASIANAVAEKQWNYGHYQE